MESYGYEVWDANGEYVAFFRSFGEAYDLLLNAPTGYTVNEMMHGGVEEGLRDKLNDAWEKQGDAIVRIGVED